MPHLGGETKIAVSLGKIPAPTPVEPVGEHLPIALTNPVQDKLRDYILDNRRTNPLRVIEQNVRLNKSVAICGAGPTLAQQLAAGITGVDEIWACNSALPYLIAQGVPVTVGIGIDQTAGLIREWADPPDVPYYLASSVDPALVAHLTSHGRSVTFFHSYVGCDEHELELYTATWPGTIMVGQGMTVASRAIGVAQWMGFERVDLYGADCAFNATGLAHANGDSPDDAYGAPQISVGEINGREWRTRPDMLMDAVQLVRRVRSTNGQLRLIGDTLPVALLGKSEQFLDLVCRQLAPGQLPPSPSSVRTASSLPSSD